MRVRFEKVVKRFGSHEALRGIDLEVESGECLVLLGPSGCGKTTLLRVLAGLESPDGGRILIGDRDVADVPPSERDIAMVFQNYALYPHLSVFENVAFPLRARRVATGEIESRVRAAIARLELQALVDRRPSQLSGGQQQRVALARAIVRSPSVYLMDEPLSNLDAQLRLHTRAELRRLQQDLKTTTLYVTHDQSEAMTLGDRIALLRQGRIDQVGPPLELYRNPSNRFVAAFLGSPRINLWPVTRGRQGEPRAAGVALPPERSPLAGTRAGGIEVGFRPEQVVVSETRTPDSIESRVVLVEPMGNETIVTLDSGGEQVVARAPADFRPTPGTPAFFSLQADRALYFDAATGARLVQ